MPSNSLLESFVMRPTALSSWPSGTGFRNRTFSSTVTPQTSGCVIPIARPMVSSSSAEAIPP